MNSLHMQPPFLYSYFNCKLECISLYSIRNPLHSSSPWNEHSTGIEVSYQLHEWQQMSCNSIQYLVSIFNIIHNALLHLADMTYLGRLFLQHAKMALLTSFYWLLQPLLYYSNYIQYCIVIYKFSNAHSMFDNTNAPFLWSTKATSYWEWILTILYRYSVVLCVKSGCSYGMIQMTSTLVINIPCHTVVY